jgi:hypothetical protein
MSIGDEQLVGRRFNLSNCRIWFLKADDIRRRGRVEILEGRGEREMLVKIPGYNGDWRRAMRGECRISSERFGSIERGTSHGGWSGGVSRGR